MTVDCWRRTGLRTMEAQTQRHPRLSKCKYCVCDTKAFHTKGYPANAESIRQIPMVRELPDTEGCQLLSPTSYSSGNRTFWSVWHGWSPKYKETPRVN